MATRIRGLERIAKTALLTLMLINPFQNLHAATQEQISDLKEKLKSSEAYPSILDNESATAYFLKISPKSFEGKYDYIVAFDQVSEKDERFGIGFFKLKYSWSSTEIISGGMNSKMMILRRDECYPDSIYLDYAPKKESGERSTKGFCLVDQTSKMETREPIPEDSLNFDEAVRLALEK